MASAWDGLLNNNAEVTELPHYAIGKGAPEDAYFTKRDVADSCVGKFTYVCRKRRDAKHKHIVIGDCLERQITNQKLFALWIASMSKYTRSRNGRLALPSCPC